MVLLIVLRILMMTIYVPRIMNVTLKKHLLIAMPYQDKKADHILKSFKK